MSELYPFLIACKAAADKRFDSSESLSLLSSKPNIHVDHLDARPRHRTRESLNYALVLLEAGGGENVLIAQAILVRVISFQEKSDPNDPLYGLWHYYAKESVKLWPFPDFNWADFNATILLLIWHRHADRLDETTRDHMIQAIKRAALSVRRRNVDLQYTNIAIKGTFVTLAAGELVQDDELISYATDRMARLHATIFASESFAEYNSPAYAAVCLGVLMAMDCYIVHPESRKLALFIQHRLWNHVACHFHAPTGEIAGPHSRAYSASMRESPGELGAILHRASDGEISYDFASANDSDPFCGLYAHLFAPNLPEEARRNLLDHDRSAEVREATQTYREGSTAVITSYLQPEFCLGSVNFQDGWEQRQNLIAYWPSENNTGFLKQEYLHDERPCCSGFFACDQRGGTALVANFLGNFADHHVSFPTEEVTASFLGVVLRLGGGEDAVVFKNSQLLLAGCLEPVNEGDTIFLCMPRIAIALKLLRHHVGLPCDHQAVLKNDKDGLRLEIPHYRGPLRKLKWTDFQVTETCYALTIKPRPAHWDSWCEQILRQDHQTDQTLEAFSFQWNQLQVAVPKAILTEREIRTFFATHDAGRLASASLVTNT